MFVTLLRVTRPSVTRRVTEFLLSRQCHHVPQSGLQYAELGIKYSGGIENNNCKIHNPDPLWSSCRYLPGHLQQQHAALQWSSSCYHDIHNYCIDINYISKSGLLFVELQEYDPPVHHQHHCDPEPSPMSPISLITLDP